MKSFGCMPAVRTPEASRTLTMPHPGILPSPLRDKVGVFDHDRFRGYVSVHFRSGLHPPCLRFAAAVAGRHARLGTRLLVRLCRGRHLRRLNFMRLQGATRTDPDLILSHHPARAIDRRLPPSVGCQAPPVASWPDPTSMTCPLRSTSITSASSLLRGSPPLSGASVLSASRLEPLVPFPLASPVRFSRSVQKPGRASRRLHAGCRSASIRASAELIPKEGSPLGS